MIKLIELPWRERKYIYIYIYAVREELTFLMHSLNPGIFDNGKIVYSANSRAKA